MMTEMRSRPFSEVPRKAGDYCYWCVGCSTSVPTFASFDGEKWLGGFGEPCELKCYWIDTDNPDPLGSENREYATPETKTDLSSRLERYKAAKRAHNETT